MDRYWLNNDWEEISTQSVNSVKHDKEGNIVIETIHYGDDEPTDEQVKLWLCSHPDENQYGNAYVNINESTIDFFDYDSNKLATLPKDLSNYVTKDMIPSSLPASDVYSWAKATTKPTYTADEVGAIPTTASCNKNWNWYGQGGQPYWLWGSNDGINMYVYDPTNFSVANSNTVKNRDVCTEIDNLKTTSVDGKTLVANAINGVAGSTYSSTTSYADLANTISSLGSINSISINQFANARDLYGDGTHQRFDIDKPVRIVLGYSQRTDIIKDNSSTFFPNITFTFPAPISGFYMTGYIYGVTGLGKNVPENAKPRLVKFSNVNTVTIENVAYTSPYVIVFDSPTSYVITTNIDYTSPHHIFAY